MALPVRVHSQRPAITRLIIIVVLLLLPICSHAQNVNWVDWHTVLPNSDIQGVANIGGTPVTVTYSGERSFVQLSCGGNYWIPSAPYISAGVPNPPPGCDIIALSLATSKTLTFSEPVANVLFAVVSLNGNGYRFDRDFNILSFGTGFWGGGTLTKQVNGLDYDLIGTGEGHGVIQLTGTFSSLTWTSLTAENWNGFSIAFENLANPPPVPALGAWGLLIMSVLLGSVGIIVVRRMN